MTRIRTAALVGNPNAGKSALFNALTGARQKIANYPGVTVERKAGRLVLPNGEPVELIDLPGAYSFEPSSPDEEVTRKVVHGELAGEATPEVLVLVLDAANLEQHLVFAQEVIALGRPTVVALNMIDLAERDGLVLDAAALSQALGVPVIPTVAVRRRGLAELTAAIETADLAKLTTAQIAALTTANIAGLNADGSLDVVETIRVRAEGNQVRRGIYRDFPTRYRDGYGNRMVVDFELLGVERDGRAEPHFTEALPNGVRINTGNDDFLPVPADIEYRLRYRTTRQLGFFDGFDELYWNVNGLGWEFATESVSARLVLPREVPADQWRLAA